MLLLRRHGREKLLVKRGSERWLKSSVRRGDCPALGTRASYLSRIGSDYRLRWKGEVEMEWYVIVILVLLVPIVLLPVAFVWYLNASGLYRVIRDARQRAKRRAKALREAELIREKAVVGPAAVVKK